MVNWYAVGLSVALLYIIPKRYVADKILNYYKYGALTVPLKTIVVILDDIGINYEKARNYAKQGAHVIIGGRDQTKLEAAKKELMKSTKNKNISAIQVNRYDKNSLRKFAEEIIDSEVAVDAIINNQGKELSDLEIIFKTQELAKERFINHSTKFLYEHSPEDL